ncbi:MAG: hypothetical protein ACR2FU_04780 [Streptosporangiaceae bacterium]
MALVSVTRLRLRAPEFADAFFGAAIAAFEQAQGSAGHLGGDVLADAENVYWTKTAWQGREQMRAFVRAQPHLETMGRLGEWCDEATFVDWEQNSGGLPDWRLSYDRLVAGGQVAKLPHPSAAHEARDFPPPQPAP